MNFSSVIKNSTRNLQNEPKMLRPAAVPVYVQRILVFPRPLTARLCKRDSAREKGTEQRKEQTHLRFQSHLQSASRTTIAANQCQANTRIVLQCQLSGFAIALPPPLSISFCLCEHAHAFPLTSLAALCFPSLCVKRTWEGQTNHRQVRLTQVTQLTRVTQATQVTLPSWPCLVSLVSSRLVCRRLCVDCQMAEIENKMKSSSSTCNLKRSIQYEVFDFN